MLRLHVNVFNIILYIIVWKFIRKWKFILLPAIYMYIIFTFQVYYSILQFINLCFNSNVFILSHSNHNLY